MGRQKEERKISVYARPVRENKAKEMRLYIVTFFGAAQFCNMFHGSFFLSGVVFFFYLGFFFFSFVYFSLKLFRCWITNFNRDWFCFPVRSAFL